MGVDVAADNTVDLADVVPVEVEVVDILTLSATTVAETDTFPATARGQVGGYMGTMMTQMQSLVPMRMYCVSPRDVTNQELVLSRVAGR